MNLKAASGAAGAFVAVFRLSQMAFAQQADPHGWLGTGLAAGGLPFTQV